MACRKGILTSLPLLALPLRRGGIGAAGTTADQPGAASNSRAALPSPVVGVGAGLSEPAGERGGSRGGQHGLPATPGPEREEPGVSGRWGYRRPCTHLCPGSPHTKGDSGVPAPPSAAPRWRLGLGPRRSSGLPQSAGRSYLLWGCRQCTSFSRASFRVEMRAGAASGSGDSGHRGELIGSPPPPNGFSPFCRLPLKRRVLI